MDDPEDGYEVVEGIEENVEEETDETECNALLERIRELQRIALDGMETFHDSSDNSRSRIHSMYCLLDHHLEDFEPSVLKLYEIAKNYDFNALRANGYRSCLKILRCCCNRLWKICNEITDSKYNILILSLRSGYHDFESFVACLGQLKSCILHLTQLPERSNEGSLFAKTDDTLFTADAEQMFSELEALNREPFYGRCLGNQFCKSMQNPLKTINVAMASFGESFNKDTMMNKLALSLMSSGKYFMNPELRAQQVVKITQNSNIDFCKAFWNIAETDILQELPMIVCPPVQVSHGFEIDPVPLSLPKQDGSGMVEIQLPISYHGVRAISARLISHTRREGQEQLLGADASKLKTEAEAQSPCLIVHCHGGGFVAQSAKSHEIYLRHWARGVGVPILSIDYSLAPESPYPRALEEIFYAYCWAIDNSDLLGSTGDRICFAGDSSGANLMLCTCLKAIKEGVRLPDGILSIYAATYVSYAPSPSRLLAVMDPLLPVGVLTRCLAAYAGFDTRDVFEHYIKKRQSMKDGILDPVIVDILKQTYSEKRVNSAPSPSSSSSSSSSSDARCRPPPPPRPPPPKFDSKDGQSFPSASSSTPNSNGAMVHSEKNKSFSKEDNTTSSESPSECKVLNKEGNVTPSSEPMSPSDGEEFHTASENTPDSPVEFTIGSDQKLRDSTEDFVSIESVHEQMNSVSFKNQSDPIHLPRRSSECLLPKHKSMPPRSNSIVGLSTDSRFNWTSFVSPETKSRIRNNLTSIGHMMWGAGPNLSKKSTSVVREGGVKPDMNLPLHVYRYLPVPDDPLMSPYCAPLDMLAKMPPVYMLACHLDPLLDDSIEFAKRLDRAGSEVHLDVFDDLPHGFLNFTLISREAKMGCDTCIIRIRQILLNSQRTG